jgi:hypothetical protein
MSYKTQFTAGFLLHKGLICRYYTPVVLKVHLNKSREQARRVRQLERQRGHEIYDGCG